MSFVFVVLLSEKRTQKRNIKNESQSSAKASIFVYDRSNEHHFLRLGTKIDNGNPEFGYFYLRRHEIPAKAICQLKIFYETKKNPGGQSNLLWKIPADLLSINLYSCSGRSKLISLFIFHFILHTQLVSHSELWEHAIAPLLFFMSCMQRVKSITNTIEAFLAPPWNCTSLSSLRANERTRNRQ